MGFGAVEGEPPGGQNPRLSESAPGASGGLRGGLGVAPVLSWGPWGPKRAQKRPMRAHGALGAPPWGRRHGRSPLIRRGSFPLESATARVRPR